MVQRNLACLPLVQAAVRSDEQRDVTVTTERTHLGIDVVDSELSILIVIERVGRINVSQPQTALSIVCDREKTLIRQTGGSGIGDHLSRFEAVQPQTTH